MIENIRDFFRNIKYGIENLIIWFPVIWKDRNWDQVYIYEIFKYKLEQTEKLLRKYGHHVNADHDADNIKICVTLLDRLIKDIYYDQAFNKYHEKWGESKFDFINADQPNMKKLQITHENVNTEEDMKAERKDFKQCCDHEDYLRKQDLDLLFKMMRKHIQTWWD